MSAVGFEFVFLPRHVGEFFRRLDGWWRGRFNKSEFGVGRGGRGFAGLGFVLAPRGDARLQAVVFGFLFVAGLHVEQREVGVNKLFLGLELLGFVAFGDGGGEVAFAIVRHAEGELRVEMRRVGREDGAQLGDAAVVIAAAESEHGFVVLFLGGHQSLRLVVQLGYTEPHDDEFANHK